MKLFKLTIIFMLIFLGLSCAAQNEVQIKSYEVFNDVEPGFINHTPSISSFKGS